MEKDSTGRDQFKSSKNKGTFIVRVDGSERGTWHGRVVWAEEERTEYFRSTLELIKMMDKALEQDNAAEASDREPDSEVG